MAKFHEGQEVEIACGPKFRRQWRKAKIVIGPLKGTKGCWQVRLRGGTIAVFDADHIRTVVSEADIAAYIKKIGDQDKADCIE